MHYFNVANKNSTRKTVFIFLVLFVFHVILTFIPIVTTPAIGLPNSINLIFLLEFIFGTGVFFYFFVKGECFSVAKVKIASIALFMLLWVQFAIYSLSVNDVGSLTITNG